MELDAASASIRMRKLGLEGVGKFEFRRPHGASRATQLTVWVWRDGKSSTFGLSKSMLSDWIAHLEALGSPTLEQARESFEERRKASLPFQLG